MDAPADTSKTLLGPSEKQFLKGQSKVRPWGLFWVSVTLACVASLAGFLGRLWWLLDLASHFCVQYFWFFLVATICLLAFRKWKTALLPFAFAMLNLALIVPCYLGNPAPLPAGRQALRALVCNVFTDNQQHDQVLELVRSTQPDFALFMEVDNRWQNALSELDATYPFNKRSARQDNFGIAFFSRLPLESIEIVKIEESPVESVLVRCRIEGKPLLIIGTHPTPPIGRTYSTLRNQQLNAIAKIVTDEKDNVMVLGDLNVTPWSPYFRDLLQHSHLRDSRIGFGVQPTWPVESLIKRIPIDHCLISPGIDIHCRWIGPDVGSDHFPVVVEFSLNRR